MAIGRVKVWIANEVLTAADLNAEFNNILNNPIALWSPAAAAASMNGLALNFDTDNNTGFVSTVNDRLDLVAGGTVVMQLGFSATQPRIKANLDTSPTESNRLLFQTSTANQSTVVGAIPNGTGTTSAFKCYSNSAPDNSSTAVLFTDGTVSGVRSFVLGTGTQLPLELHIATTAHFRIKTDGNIEIPGTGKRILGDFLNATVASRVMFQNSSANTSTSVAAIPNGTGTTASWVAFENADPNNSAFVAILGDSAAGAAILRSSITGTGTQRPLQFHIGSVVKAEILTGGAFVLRRNDSGSEGGQLSLARAIDDVNHWAIDVFGATGDPNLRIIGSSNVQAEITSTAPLSGETAFLFNVNDGAVTSMRRVSVGAADSGGTGFRLLRVTN